jgi:hypothetical protein
MAGPLRRTLIGSAVLAIALAFGAAPADATPVADEVVPLTVGARLVNADGDTAGKCLDGYYINVRMHTCNNTADQDWVITSTGRSGYIYFSPRNGAGWCLADVGYSGQGQQVQLLQGCNRLNQEWSRTWYNNYFQVKNYWSGRCLDVRDYGMSNVVQAWPCLNQGNQKWKWH